MTLYNTRPPKRWQCPSPLDKRAHAQIFQIREFLIGRGQSWAIVGNGHWTYLRHTNRARFLSSTQSHFRPAVSGLLEIIPL